MNNKEKTNPAFGTGIDDSLFERGDVPMTKSEIRTITLSKLRLQSDSVVVDIGAGTGSVSVEAAIACPEGKVYAVEKNEQAQELIKTNAQKFGASNIELVKGCAPDALEGISGADRVFIGGSCGRLREIFGWIEKATARDAVVAANAITLENAALAIKLLEEGPYKDIDISLVQVSKGRRVHGLTMMSSNNPVYIISARRRD